MFWKVFNLNLCSATSMKSSPRDIYNDMAVHRPRRIFKCNQNTFSPPPFWFYTLKSYSIPLNGVLFLLCVKTIKHEFLLEQIFIPGQFLGN